MKRSFLVGFLGFGCLVTPHLDGQTTEEPAILGLVELSLDVPVKTGAGTLVLTSIVSETIAESPSLPTSYPAGSGITFYFSLDGVKFELSSMSEGYESHTSAWVEDVRVTLVDAQYRDAPMLRSASTGSLKAGSVSRGPRVPPSTGPWSWSRRSSWW